MKQIFSSTLVTLALVCDLGAQEVINFDLSLKAGLTSVNNSDGMDFSKTTLAADGVVDLGYAIRPRVDLVYVGIDEKHGSVNSLWQLAADGLYDFELDPAYLVDPYLFGGLGYEYVSGSRKGFESQFFIQGGVGLKYKVNNNFSLVGEYKALQMIDTSKNDEKNEFAILIGASMPFHIQTNVAPDEDGDGVLNAADLCPHTPPGAKVGIDGCEIAKKPKPPHIVKPIAKPTEKIVSMEVVPRPLRVFDADRDGVPDKLDQCPNTPKGFEVNVKGCGVKKRLEVYFDSNSAQLTPDSKVKIKAFADYMKRKPDISVTIEGYTDSSGDMKKNMQLSQQRANTVKKALVSYGIKPSRITAVGKGPLNPIADNDTPEGRAKNRRIEAIIH